MPHCIGYPGFRQRYLIGPKTRGTGNFPAVLEGACNGILFPYTLFRSTFMNTTVLIVEDSLETLELLRRIIEKQGDTALLASDGEKGLSYARRFSPDIIILDRLLPKMNGLQVCQVLKAEPATADIPIIFLSVLDSEKDIVEGLKGGADDYIKKPFSPDELTARIETVLRRYRKKGGT